MKEIKIQWTEDCYDCEDCGPSWANGANVFIDNDLVLELVPKAHCYCGQHYDEETVYLKIIEHLGYKVEIV